MFLGPRNMSTNQTIIQEHFDHIASNMTMMQQSMAERQKRKAHKEPFSNQEPLITENRPKSPEPQNKNLKPDSVLIIIIESTPHYNH